VSGVGLLTVFVLAVFVGFEVVSKVSTTLHTPLMSGANAIHGVILVGAILVTGSADGWVQTALGLHPRIEIFGQDYTTRDGTCVRDYIQVTDLIDAHLNALAYLRGGGASVVCNCGYGHGETVKEVVEVVKRVSGVDFPVVVSARRPGDPAAIVAKPDRARSVLGWKPTHDNLDEIVRQALDWERRLHNRRLDGAP